MKTKILGGIAIVAIAIAVALNVSLNTSKTNNASLLALANVEALAQGEGSISLPCNPCTVCICTVSVTLNDGTVGTMRVDQTKNI